jgi:Tol biopolymer transport system component
MEQPGFARPDSRGRLSLDWLERIIIARPSNGYVAAYGGGQGKWQVSNNEGVSPKWSKDGKQLYYFNVVHRTVFSVPVTQSNGARQFGPGQPLAVSPASQQGFYDVSPDGKKILLDMITQQVSQSITVVTNFGTALKK